MREQAADKCERADRRIRVCPELGEVVERPDVHALRGVREEQHLLAALRQRVDSGRRQWARALETHPNHRIVLRVQL